MKRKKFSKTFLCIKFLLNGNIWKGILDRKVISSNENSCETAFDYHIKKIQFILNLKIKKKIDEKFKYHLFKLLFNNNSNEKYVNKFLTYNIISKKHKYIKRNMSSVSFYIILYLSLVMRLVSKFAKDTYFFDIFYLFFYFLSNWIAQLSPKRW